MNAGFLDVMVYDPVDTSVGGTHALFIIRGEPEEYNLPAAPEVPTVHLGPHGRRQRSPPGLCWPAQYWRSWGLLMLLSALIGLSLLAPGGEGRRLAIIGVLLALWPFLRSRKHSGTGLAVEPSMPLMMLLNLAPGDTVDDIESAPPLGSQDEVREQIVAALPSITFDTQGRGTFIADNGALDVDLGTTEPVYTAVLTVRGAAGPTVARLLGETRWRAFVPRRGTFVNVADLRKRWRR